MFPHNIEKSNSIGIFSNIDDKLEYVADLHRESYVNISSDSIDILKLNFIIITAFIALLGFIYKNMLQFSDVNIILLSFGILSWIVSSVLCWYLYSKSRYAIDDQITIFFNQTKPEIPQTPLSIHFARHQSRSEILSGCATACFLLSLLSIFLLSLSILSAPVGINIVVTLLVLASICLGYGLAMVLVMYIEIWKERSTIKYEFQRNGFSPHKHTIVRILSKLPRTENLGVYNSPNENQIFVASDDLIANSYMEVRVYPRPIKSGAAASGVLKGKSRPSWDIVHRIMTTKSKFSIFVELDDEITEYQNCVEGWDDLDTIIWDYEEIVKHSK